MPEYIGARNAEAATGIKGFLNRILNKLKGKPSAQEAYELLSESQRALIDGMEGDKTQESLTAAEKNSLMEEYSNSAQPDITAQYERAVDEILDGKYTGSKTVLVGYTPAIYRKLGMPSLPFVIGSGHVYSAAKTESQAKAEGKYNAKTNYHGLGAAAVKNIWALHLTL